MHAPVPVRLTQLAKGGTGADGREGCIGQAGPHAKLVRCWSSTSSGACGGLRCSTSPCSNWAHGTEFQQLEALVGTAPGRFRRAGALNVRRVAADGPGFGTADLDDLFHWLEPRLNQELVQTPNDAPGFDGASMASRSLRSMALWWRAKLFISGQAKQALMPAFRLTGVGNNRVLTPGLSRATSSSYMRSPRCPARAINAVWKDVWISVQRWPAHDLRYRCRGQRRAACSRLPMVALIAQVCSSGQSCRSQLRQSSV